MTNEQFKKYLQESDTRMKESNGHSYVTILKTRCQYCGRSPHHKSRCKAWFQTFIDDLESVLREHDEISEGEK